MSRINDPQSLEAWLEGKPAALAAALASRVALRALPLALGKPVEQSPLISGDRPQKRAAAKAVHLLRAHAVARAALKDMAFTPAESALRDAMEFSLDFQDLDEITEATQTMLRCAHAAFRDRGTAGKLATGAPKALEQLHGTFEALTADCEACDAEGLDPVRLLSRPLWPVPRPRWFEDALGRTYGRWHDEEARWRVWDIWYVARLEGQSNEWGLPPPIDTEFSERLLRADRRFWQKGASDPALLNQTLLEWGAELAHREMVVSGPGSVLPTRVPVDLDIDLDIGSASPLRREGWSRGYGSDELRLKAMLPKIERSWAEAIGLRAALRLLPLGLGPFDLGTWLQASDQWRWMLLPAGAILWGMAHHQRDDEWADALIYATTGTAIRGGPNGGFADLLEQLLHAFMQERDDAAIDRIMQLLPATAIAGAMGAPAIERNDVLARLEDARLRPMLNGSDKEFSNALALLSVADFWEGIHADLDRVHSDRSAQELIDRPLWYGNTPKWWGHQWTVARSIIGEVGQGLHIWTEWYERRLKGKMFSFAFPDEAADAEFYRRLTATGTALWDRAASDVNAEIGGWIADLCDRPRPEPDVHPVGARDDVVLSDFTEGLVIEAQSNLGLTFARRDDGLFSVDEAAGSGELLTTPEACGLHAELKDTLEEAAASFSGHNQAGSLAPLMLQVAQLMGQGPGDLNIGRFMQRAERCIKLSAAMAIDLQGEATLAELPVVTREAVVMLEGVSDAYWAMVQADPALEARLRLLKDRTSVPQPQVSVAEHLEVARQSVEEELIAPEDGAILAEMGEGLDDGEEADPRRMRRLLETMRNLPSAVVRWLSANQAKLLWLGTAATAIDKGSKGIVTAGRWLVAHSEWIHRVFADRPGMLKVIDRLIALARQLPPS